MKNLALIIGCILLFINPVFSKIVKKSDIIYGEKDLAPQFCLSRWDFTGQTGKSQINPRPFSEKIKLKTYTVLKQNSLPADLREYLDTGDGYKIRLTFTVNGRKLSSLQIRQVEDVAVDIQEKIGKEVDSKIREFAKNFVSFKGSTAELNELVEQEDAELRMIIQESSVNRILEKAVLSSLMEFDKSSKLYTEWKVNCEVKSDAACLKITKSAIINHLNSGADVSSYGFISGDVKKIYQIVDDIQINERKFRKEYIHSINDFIKTHYSIAGLIEKFYTKYNIDEKLAIKKVIDASAGAGSVNYLQLMIIGTTTKNVSGEDARSLYRTYLADAREQLETELKKLSSDEDKIKISGDGRSCRLRSLLQRLKRDCSDIMRILSEKEACCNRDEKKVEELVITIKEDTSLYDLKKLKNEIELKKISEITMKENFITKSADDIKIRYKLIIGTYKSFAAELALQ